MDQAKQFYKAYNLASQNLPKTRQIVMLYDGAINALRQAKESIKEKRIQERYNLTVRASNIISGLQGSLDFENGGEIAHVLFEFYNSIHIRLMTLNQGGTQELCDEIIAELKDMRDTWNAIDQKEGGTTAPQQDGASGNAGGGEAEGGLGTIISA